MSARADILLRHVWKRMDVHVRADSEKLLTKGEIVASCNVSQRTLDKWIKKRMINYIKLGRSVRFIRSDVEKFIQEHTIRSKATGA